ncbi:MAG: VRR-NUC domain-containing protein [Lysobacter sp.]|nr:VRR-NUC domain-containing protein [Lysobacter sp.]
MSRMKRTDLSTTDCAHEHVSCLNAYELIRKYRCDTCAGVMMCACDESFGKRFLAHQLATGRELDTQSRVLVTLGFVPAICNECRGLAPAAAPVTAGFGRTSKIKRYYWREIYFAERLRQAQWDESHPDATPEQRTAAVATIESEVLEQIKAQHAQAPKYDFTEQSQAEVLKLGGVSVQAVHANYCDEPSKGAVIRLGDMAVSPERFVIHWYESRGWSAMILESAPFHALFGVMMWILIQDPGDSRVRTVGFGDRTAYEARGANFPIWTLLPDDFGSKGYADRRKQHIDAHFELMPHERADMLWLFDYWVPFSSDLRQYLWAHRDEDVVRARRLIEILTPAQIHSVLRYLISHYWGHYLGWPDLLLHRSDEILLAEVKSSNDRLSGDQKRWIVDNKVHLGFPFSLVKLHRSRQ